MGSEKHWETVGFFHQDPQVPRSVASENIDTKADKGQCKNIFVIRKKLES